MCNMRAEFQVKVLFERVKPEVEIHINYPSFQFFRR